MFMVKVKTMLEKIFYITFMLLPCAASICLAINYMLQNKIANYKLNIITFVIAFLGFIFLFFRIILVVDSKKEAFWVCILTLCAFAYRFYVIDYIDAMPTSDFQTSYNDAKSWAVDGYSFRAKYQKFTYWGLWTYILSILFRVTGDTSVRGVQIFNMIIGSLTVPLIYEIVKIGLISCNQNKFCRKISYLSAVTYSFMPGIVTYTGVLTQEHLAAFLGCLAVFLLVAAYNREKNKKSKYNYYIYIVAGVSLGIMNWVRPIAGIIIIAWIIVACFFKLPSMFKDKLFDWKNMRYFAATILIVVIVQFMANQSGLYLLSNALGIPKQKLENCATWRTIAIGLNTKDNGKIGDFSREFDTFLPQEYSGNDLTIAWRQIAVENVKQNYKELFPLFIIKFNEQWRGEPALISWGWKRSSGISDEEVKYYNNIMKYNQQILCIVHTVIYTLTMILCLFSGVHLYKKNNFALFICSLTVLGFMLVGIIIESQNRYKSVIYWCFAILSGPGMYEIYLMLKYVCQIILKYACRLKIIWKRCDVK